MKKTIFFVGDWVVTREDWAFRALNSVTGELLEGNFEYWTLKRWIRHLKRRNGWDYAYEKGLLKK